MTTVDFTAWDTQSWIRGLRSYVEVVEDAVPKAGRDHLEELTRRAAAEDWDSAEYEVEIEGLHEQFEEWLPNASAYSIIVLTHSLVETQLFQYARRIQRRDGLSLKIGDVKGRGVIQAQLYLTKVAKVPITGDPGWPKLSHLQDLRNVIVHRRGRHGSGAAHEKTVRALLAAYPQWLRLSSFPSTLESKELVVHFRLCDHFIDEVEAFFERFCGAAGFQVRAWQ